MRRYALAIDAVLGAALAVVAMAIAGSGTVGFGAVLTLSIVLLWIAIERAMARRRMSASRS